MVVAGVGSAVGQGGVDAFDFCVGLGPVGAGLLHVDAELVVELVAVVGPLGRAVVGQDAFDGDVAGCKPGDGPCQDL